MKSKCAILQITLLNTQSSDLTKRQKMIIKLKKILKNDFQIFFTEFVACQPINYLHEIFTEFEEISLMGKIWLKSGIPNSTISMTKILNCPIAFNIQPAPKFV